MTAIGPGDHEQFCRNDNWDRAGGTGHDKWEKRLPDGRLLRTTIQRHKTEYGSSLKAQVLSQLEVNEATLLDVLRSGRPADRPAPEPEGAIEPKPDWIARALQEGRLNEDEIKTLTTVEAEHLAMVYFSTPTEFDGAAVRLHLLEALDAYRRRD